MQFSPSSLARTRVLVYLYSWVDDSLIDFDLYSIESYECWGFLLTNNREKTGSIHRSFSPYGTMNQWFKREIHLHIYVIRRIRYWVRMVEVFIQNFISLNIPLPNFDLDFILDWNRATTFILEYLSIYDDIYFYRWFVIFFTFLGVGLAP